MQSDGERQRRQDRDPLEEVLEKLLMAMGLPTRVAMKDARTLAGLEPSHGARYKALHPYSIGMLIERAIHTSQANRLVLEVSLNPESADTLDLDPNRVNVTVHDINRSLDEMACSAEATDSHTKPD